MYLEYVSSYEAHIQAFSTESTDGQSRGVQIEKTEANGKKSPNQFKQGSAFEK